MMKKVKSLLAPACLGLFLLSFASCDSGGREGTEGYDDATWNKWDGDADERLDSEEFGIAYKESGYFKSWDVNQDQGINQEEWQMNLNSKMGPDYDEGEYGSFEDWDANADGVLDEKELEDGVFAYYDTNKDSYIAEEEYSVWSYGLHNQKTESSTSTQ